MCLSACLQGPGISIRLQSNCVNVDCRGSLHPSHRNLDHFRKVSRVRMTIILNCTCVCVCPSQCLLLSHLLLSLCVYFPFSLSNLSFFSIELFLFNCLFPRFNASCIALPNLFLCRLFCFLFILVHNKRFCIIYWVVGTVSILLN